VYLFFIFKYITYINYTILMRHLKIEQNNSQVEVISLSLINKIYDYVHSNSLDNNSNLKGSLYVQHTYEEYANEIRHSYPQVIINVLEYYILFKCKAMETALYNKFNIGDGIGITKTQAAAVTNIPSSWDNKAFGNNTDITSFDELKYFTNVTTIDDYAFDLCTNLKSIDLSNITRIKYAAFSQCSSLESVNLSKVTDIASKAFQYCTNLSNINSDLHQLRQLGYDFTFCATKITGDINLTGIVSSNDIPEPVFVNTQIRSIIYGTGCGFGKSNTFTGGRRMDFNWKNYISSPNLVFIDLSLATIKRINDYGYNNCTTLRLIKFPSTITGCGNYIFSNCSALEAIVLPVETPPQYTGEEYSNMNVTKPFLFNQTTVDGKLVVIPPNTNVRIYVPRNSVELYKSTDGWSKYSDYILSIEDDYVDPDYYTKTFQNN